MQEQTGKNKGKPGNKPPDSVHPKSTYTKELQTTPTAFYSLLFLYPYTV